MKEQVLEGRLHLSGCPRKTHLLAEDWALHHQRHGPLWGAGVGGF